MITQHPEASTQPTELRLEHEQDLSTLCTLADLQALTTLVLERSHLSDLASQSWIPRARYADVVLLSLCERPRPPSRAVPA